MWSIDTSTEKADGNVWYGAVKSERDIRLESLHL